MKHQLSIVLLVFLASSPSLRGADLLDLRLPPMRLEGTLEDFARDLGKLGFRVCVEEVNLSSEPTVAGIHMESRERTLHEIFEQLTRDHPEIGWEKTYFLMCPTLHLFRRSSVRDPRNPLNVVLRQYSFKDADLVEISELIYFSSEQFRSAINPKGLQWARAGSRIGGTSMKPFDLRYSFYMDGWTLRELLNGLSCVSVNHGTSWYFWYDPNRRFPDNFIVKKF